MWFFKRAVDPRDVREKLRADVMGMALKVGADRVPPALLDEACTIEREKGMRAARDHIAKAAPLPR